MQGLGRILNSPVFFNSDRVKRLAPRTLEMSCMMCPDAASARHLCQRGPRRIRRSISMRERRSGPMKRSGPDRRSLREHAST